MRASATAVSAIAMMLALTSAQNSSYTNPILPGWHSDPSCIFVSSFNNTFFCATSTFLVTPGIPIFSSQDLIHWSLASHVINRPSQLPNYNTTYQSSDGIYAPTLRFHNGIFYVVTAYFGSKGIQTLLFRSADPFSDTAWQEPQSIETIGYDPDLFFDDDGTAYLTTTPMNLAQIDLGTGALSNITNVWNGTGGAYPEGPHVYKKDGYYYLMISEGGTELGHAVTIARSSPSIFGPYESFPGNPILTNRNTSEYFQTVGHADIFQDGAGNYWACALSTRSGPEWTNYPMGRETVLVPVTWATGEWPVFSQVRGRMEGWPLPVASKPDRSDLVYVTDDDVIDFEAGKALPSNLVYWRWPNPESFAISPSERVGTLKLTPTGELSTLDGTTGGADGITLIMRVQTHTEFDFSVDIEYQPRATGEEAGITVFLTQQQHIDLSLTLRPSATSDNSTGLVLQLRTTQDGTYDEHDPFKTVKKVPASWSNAPISLQVSAVNDTHYVFTAASSRDRADRIVLGAAPATLVSGGTGRFTGSLVGAYATKNNGTGASPAYISRWRYTGGSQKIEN